LKSVLSTGLAGLTLCLVASCAASSEAVRAQSAASADSAQPDSSAAAGRLAAPVQLRLDALQAAVDGWQRAGDLAAAKAAAVLGGSWADAAGRWQEVRTRVAAWSQTNNTYPALSSHPQRVVGWASLTLAAPTLELAREYAGHAQLHVRVTREALNGC